MGQSLRFDHPSQNLRQELLPCVPVAYYLETFEHLEVAPLTLVKGCALDQSCAHCASLDT